MDAPKEGGHAFGGALCGPVFQRDRRTLRELSEHSAGSKFCQQRNRRQQSSPRRKPRIICRRHEPFAPTTFWNARRLFLAAGLVLSSMLGTTAWVKIKNSQFITVKGSTRKNVKSDLVVWKGSFTAEAPTLLEAQQQTQGRRRESWTIFERQRRDQSLFSSRSPLKKSRPVFERDRRWRKIGSQQRTVGYQLTQTVAVESDDVDRLAQLDTTPLVEQGVLFTTEPPQFLYTQGGRGKNRDAGRRHERCPRPRRTNRRAGRPEHCQFARRRNGRVSDHAVAQQATPAARRE